MHSGITVNLLADRFKFFTFTKHERNSQRSSSDRSQPMNSRCCMPSNWINFPDLFCFPILMYILHHFIFFSLLVFIILFQVKVCSLSRLSTVFPGILSSSAKVLSYGYLCFSTFYYFSMMTRLRMFQFLTTFTCSTS